MIKDLQKLEVPKSLNYAAAFLTMSCSYRCVFCLNSPEQDIDRDKLFPMQNSKTHVGLTPQEWIAAINRLPKEGSPPISYCGGEPSIYWNGDGLNIILDGVENYGEILTNLSNTKVFKNLGSNIKKLQRPSPYPSIRVSYHPMEANRIYRGRGFEELVDRCLSLADYGFDVTPDMTTSDVALYEVSYPENEIPPEHLWQGKIPFEVKDYLGRYQNKTYGNYAYPFATDLLESGTWDKTLDCMCLTNELLMSPAGEIFACHAHLYQSWAGKLPVVEMEHLRKKEFRFNAFGAEIYADRAIKPIAHALDPELDLSILSTPKPCSTYGACHGCDLKVKRQHFKEGEIFTGRADYCSVRIDSIQWPSELKGLV